MKNDNSQPVSCMSNAKWAKFFTILKDHQINYRKASWKLVGNDEWNDTWRLDGQFASDTEEFTVTNSGEPIKYMDIEQIKIPRTFKPRSKDTYVKEQDIEKFGRLLKKNGSFKIESDAESLTIFGYK